MTSKDICYIASGFYEDCVKLLDTFKSYKTIRFQEFCKAWTEMKFSLVFLYKKNYGELLEFCEETLFIAKQFITLSKELIDQVGGLYLLYGLYYKIPVEDVKIRVTLNDWKIFLQLHQQLVHDKLYDANYIFAKLVYDNAYHHCLFPHEYRLEKSFKVRENILDNPYSVLPSITEEAESGEIAKIKELSKLYDKQKSKLLNVTGSKLQLFDKNFVNDIITKVEAIQCKKETLSGLRKKNKQLHVLNNTEKSRTYISNKIRPKLGHGFDTDSSDDENINVPFEFVEANTTNLPRSFDAEENDAFDQNSINNSSQKE